MTDDSPSESSGWKRGRVIVRWLLVVAWLLVVGSTLYLFFFHRELLKGELQSAASFSLIAGSVVYLFFGCIRAFTFVPSTYLVVAAIPFFPAPYLLALTLIGIVVSSACIFYFARALHLEELLAGKHAGRIQSLTAALTKYELPVIIAWSFCPIAPTDLICYVCGILKLRFWKCILGVTIGEGAICAVYIFAGDYLLRTFQIRL
jgi:uncharacterized membrane protein YdjX (TVP38/TMEM64 family)